MAHGLFKMATTNDDAAALVDIVQKKEEDSIENSEDYQGIYILKKEYK
jgi:hypothetical protein